ncbi:ankyrin repeat-containing protein [Fusarium heterosporum]|uniref:Ankyrin repeat-containing protein n=1 Tax=Fusarium heterosporum TaxID=42747 RepID=A0A8H5X054_FUSHE|nr:ankyrin repeat-containing protein [Fusarium heterosporum]
MVFYTDPLVELALKEEGMAKHTHIQDKLERLSLEHLTKVCRKQIMSFVDIPINEGEGGYSFILEIVCSGLGLGYHGYPGITTRPANPLTGEALNEPEVIFESRVDRAMIDVALEIKRDFPGVLLSSCTRLPDIISPEGFKYGTSYQTGKFQKWPDGERKIAKQLRGLHGGLYPQSNLVVADDPAAEVAARTWIDQRSRLDRKKLLHEPYYQWLSASEDTYRAIKELNGDFLANKYEKYEVRESEKEKQNWVREAIERSQNSKPAGHVIDSSEQVEDQDAVAFGEEAAGRQDVEQGANDRKDDSDSTNEIFEWMAHRYKQQRTKDRKQEARWRKKVNEGPLPGRGRMQKNPPPSGAYRIMNDDSLSKMAQRQSAIEHKKAQERRQMRDAQQNSVRDQVSQRGQVDETGQFNERDQVHQRDEISERGQVDTTGQVDTRDQGIATGARSEEQADDGWFSCFCCGLKGSSC